VECDAVGMSYDTAGAAPARNRKSPPSSRTPDGAERPTRLGASGDPRREAFDQRGEDGRIRQEEREAPERETAVRREAARSAASWIGFFISPPIHKEIYRGAALGWWIVTPIRRGLKGWITVYRNRNKRFLCRISTS
jgi:hypothetical protein